MFNINSKITLIKKSGPGELIGDTEKELINGAVDFSGVQFDQPGNYIISVIPSSPDLESTEFNINIEAEDDFISQDESRGNESSPAQGSRPIISQIDKPSVKLESMQFDASTVQADNKEIGIGLGFTPFFWYNGISIPERDISSLEIYYDEFVPRAKVTFKDTLGIVKSEEGMPLNDTKFELFLNSGSDNLKSIHLKFKLEIAQDNKRGTYTITGTLNLPEFYKISSKSYEGTSFEVMRNISKELEIGFNSNIDNTNDKMKWRRGNKLFKDFIQDIISHSYISDNSFLVGYIDYYYCFNYVDIEKEWARDISGDVGINSQGIAYLSEEREDVKIAPLILTNDNSENSSPFYFSRFKLNNNSTYQSTQKGHFTISKVYDRSKKQFLQFNIDSISSTDDTKIILKGSPNDKKELETNYRTNYSGKIDTDNVHQNYLYAVDQNKRNMDNLVNISVDIDLPQPNFNLYKYQKVRINFINQKQTVTSPKLVDERLSGDWIIIDIRYTWSKSKLTQKIIAVRKELGKTTEEIQEQVTKNDTSNNRELNDNPTTENSILPNSSYKEGETYTVEDVNGNRFVLNITSILENGDDIVGTLKKL